MLECSAVGNIGTPYSLREGEARYVAELSSFNLEYFLPFSDAAVITNISPNHLDWHDSLEDYVAAKLNALKNASSIVLPPELAQLAPPSVPLTLFSTKHTAAELYGLGATHAVHIRRGQIFYDGAPIIHTSVLARSEEHNLLNFMAACALVYPDADTDCIRAVGQSFTLPSHRAELVHTSSDGVRFIDSSIDTSPERTKTTLSTFSGRLLLLLGGRSQGLDPSVMLEEIATHALAIAIYGEYRCELYDALCSFSATRSIPTFMHEKFINCIKFL